MNRQPYRSTNTSGSGITGDTQNGHARSMGGDRGAERIDPARAAAGLARWRRLLANATGEDQSVGLEDPRRLLTMLKVFGATRRFADVCLAQPQYAAKALNDGPSDILAEAARDLSSLDEAIGGPEALHGALAAIKMRADIAIGIAELMGRWTISEATTARTDLAERLIETALAWLVRSAISRGELTPEAGSGDGLFAIAGCDFAHEDLTPLGPLDLLVIYAPDAFANTTGRSVERAFVRLGAELREALEGRPGDFPIFTLTTPMGSGVGGAGLVETVGAIETAIGGEQNAHLRRWFAGARLVAGDRTRGGAFMEGVEAAIWGEQAIFTEKTREVLLTEKEDPQADFRSCADILRWSLGRARPVFRTASAGEVFTIAAESGVIGHEAALRLAAGFDLTLKAASYGQMVRGLAGGTMRDDEKSAVAALSGFDDVARYAAVIDGARAEARNMLIRLINGPQIEIRRYHPEDTDGEASVDGDAEKLEGLGFNNGFGLASLLDGWAALCSSEEGGRFAAVAPGLTTEFSETQHPDEAALLFDKLLRLLPSGDAAFASRLAKPEQRAGIVNALGNFGPAVEPLLEDEDGARLVAGDVTIDAPSSAQALLERNPAPDGGDVTKLGTWRRKAIASCACYLADGAMSFDAANDALEAIQTTTFTRLFDGCTSGATDAGLTLHHFEGPTFGLPGAVASLGFMRTGEDQAGAEKTAREFIDRLEQLGSGFFAVTPNVAHRPGGVAGSLAPTHAEYRAFVQSEAIATDQIMLARARVIAGTEDAAAVATKTLRAAVASPRRADILFRDLDRARGQRMRRRGETSLWDFDVMDGGLLDTDLIISTLIYRHAGAQPGLQNGSIEDGLDLMARANLIPGDVAETLKAARRFWRRMALARTLARWSDPQVAPVRKRYAETLARAAAVDSFSNVRPIMRGYADDVSRLYAQLVLGNPSLSLVANGG